MTSDTDKDSRPARAEPGRSARRIGRTVSARFRALDRRLHIDHTGRSEWIWAVPVLSFLGTFALIALLIAALIAGMSVAYMTPEAEPADDDGASARRAPRPPQPLDDWSRWMR